MYLTSVPGDFINGVTLSYVVKQPSHIGQKSDPTTTEHRHHHYIVDHSCLLTSGRFVIHHLFTINLHSNRVSQAKTTDWTVNTVLYQNSPTTSSDEKKTA